MNDMADLFPARVRGLQAIYPEAHLALLNWGAWSRHDSERPQGIHSPTFYESAKIEEWGEKDDEDVVVVETSGPAKADARDEEPYNVTSGGDLDSRIHGAGGLPDFVRLVLRVAYVYTVPEAQYVREAKAIGWRWQLNDAGCNEDAFCERLEAGLRFVGRFV